jgi:hypothetical protein
MGHFKTSDMRYSHTRLRHSIAGRSEPQNRGEKSRWRGTAASKQSHRRVNARQCRGSRGIFTQPPHSIDESPFASFLVVQSFKSLLLKLKVVARANDSQSRLLGGLSRRCRCPSGGNLRELEALSKRREAGAKQAKG